MKLALLFTWDVSLKIWKDKGLLEREIRLYQDLAKMGVEITFLTWGAHDDEEIAKDLPEFTIIPLYTKVPAPKSKVLRALCSFLVPLKMRSSLKMYHLLKTNQMWGSWVGVLAKWLCGTPLLLRSGFELYDFTVKQNHGFLRRSFIWFMSKIAYSSADYVVVAADHDKKIACNKFGVSQDMISIHPNWIDTKRFQPKDIAQKERHVLFVGRLNSQKNLEMLIEAISNLDITLDIVGQGELQDQLTSLAQEKKASVNFLGSVPNDQLPELYNRYPVFVLPSHYEGNPKTLLEAMACGAAVIGTDVDGIASVIDHNCSGFLVQKEVQAIKNALQELLGDQELRQKIGEGARSQILKTQSLETILQKEHALYQRMAVERVEK